jgi:hypothetical protein
LTELWLRFAPSRRTKPAALRADDKPKRLLLAPEDPTNDTMMATQNDPQDTPAQNSGEESVAEQTGRARRTTAAAAAQRKTKAELLEELANRDAKIAELYQLLADSHNRARQDDEVRETIERDRQTRDDTEDT